MSERAIHSGLPRHSVSDERAQLGGGRMDMSGMRSPHSLKNRMTRVIWGAVWLLLFRPSPRPLRRWRNFLLRVFGAQIDKTAVIYPSTRIWGPWNLTMGKHSCLAAGVEVY